MIGATCQMAPTIAEFRPVVDSVIFKWRWFYSPWVESDNPLGSGGGFMFVVLDGDWR